MPVLTRHGCCVEGGCAGLEGQAPEKVGREGVDFRTWVNSPEQARMREEVKSSYFGAKREHAPEVFVLTRASHLSRQGQSGQPSERVGRGALESSY